MADIYKSHEVPVRWKSTEPGFVLTAGLSNTLELTLKDHPTAGPNRLSDGFADLSIFAMPGNDVLIAKIEDVPVSSTEGHITVELDLPEKCRRGYYKGHLLIKDAQGRAREVYEFWVIVDKKTKPEKDTHLELTSVRSQFADICEFDNKMLDSLEIGTGDIASAVNRCLEQWRSVAPRVTSYNGNNFPYTELLRNGVLFQLLQVLCTLLSRNKMTYTAGGVAVDLEARLDHFKQLKAQYEAYWRSGMAQIKMEENLNNFYGHLSY